MRISDWSSDVCSSDLLAVIGERDCSGLRLETDHACHRSEGFLARDQHVLRHARQYGRLEKAAAQLVAMAARQNDGTLCGGVGDVLLHLFHRRRIDRSEEHTSELQSLMRISYAVVCLKKKNTTISE